jgi:two-component system sensor histidine kinase PilS (NtrC family)
VGAATASAAFCLLALLMEHGVLNPPAPFLDRPPLPTGQLVLSLAANVSAFFLAAALSAHLADALQGARKELAKRETQLTALSELHESIVHSITSGLLTIDGSRRITFLNRAGEEIMGVRVAEIAGEPLAARFPDLADALERTQPGRGESRVCRANGATRLLGYSVAPLVDAGTPAAPGYVIVFQDLTPFREMEEAMRRNDRLAAVGKLAAGLAHEIRNPLASMCGSIELLGHAPGLADKDRRLMEIVLREAERLEALVRDFLGFARPQEPQLTVVDAGAQLEEALAIFRGEVTNRGLTLGADIEPAVLVRADPAQLKQVVWNLLSNAADATSAGGRVSVRLRRVGAHAVLEVADTGLGISSEDLPHIFDPFFTTKEKGTGLGLALVHRIIERHGGRIEVRSEPGSGTTFRIELAAEAPAAAASASRTLGASA